MQIYLEPCANLFFKEKFSYSRIQRWEMQNCLLCVMQIYLFM